MLPGKQECWYKKVDIGTHSFEAVSEFQYLGPTVNNEKWDSNKINNRMIAGTVHTCSFSSRKFFTKEQ